MDKNGTPSTPARDKLLETAGRLFYRSGFHAVGVDTIAAEAGITKMTLYKYFPSKDHLITAYLTRYEAEFCEWIEIAIRNIQDPAEQLAVIFEKIQEKATSVQCLGCSFQSVALEFPSSEHRVHQAAVVHKESVLKRFEMLGKQAGLRDPEQLARQLLLLMDGAWIASRLYGPDNPASAVAEAARAVLASHGHN